MKNRLPLRPGRKHHATSGILLLTGGKTRLRLAFHHLPIHIIKSCRQVSSGECPVLAGLLWLASCSSSPKSRDYPGYMTRPYTIRGHRYHPMNVEQALTYEQTGIASHYNECALWGLVSGKTAIGENVRPWHLHAAHPTLPLPCEVLVQSLRTGKTVKVRVNDRGPSSKTES